MSIFSGYHYSEIKSIYHKIISIYASLISYLYQNKLPFLCQIKMPLTRMAVRSPSSFPTTSRCFFMVDCSIIHYRQGER